MDAVWVILLGLFGMAFVCITLDRFYDGSVHVGHKPVWGKWRRLNDSRVQIRECEKCGFTESRQIW